MKYFFKRVIFLTLFMSLAACGQSVTTMSLPSPSTSATLTRTITPSPSETTTATIEPTQTLLPIPTLEPTLLPTIEATLIPDLLSSAFMVHSLNGINGHAIHEITGWSYGFRPRGYCFGSYKWLNQNHLLLFPLVGQEYGMGIMQLSLPIVINYDNGKVWIPSTDGLLRLSSCDQPLWSHTLNVLITKQGRETIVLNPQGGIINRYPGINISLAPSGTKLIIGGVWIDLLSGKQVDFSSQEIEAFSTWSSDENQLYSCCYYYGNARTGKAYPFELDGLSLVGRDYPEGSTGIAKATWVMNDTYVVTHWDFEGNIFPLIEPATQTYKDLRKVTDIPDDASCLLGGIAPSRKQIWVNCYKPNNYLVDLETFSAEPYPGELTLVAWSKNSDFAWLRNYNRNDNKDNIPQILSVTSKKLQPFPAQAEVKSIFWHPTNSVLAYLTLEKQMLMIWDVSTMSVRELVLPAPFHNIVWSPNGEWLALFAKDGSLWQVDYPKLEHLEQLTPSLSEVRDIQWSPDSKSISFLNGSDIYIVDTTK